MNMRCVDSEWEMGDLTLDFDGFRRGDFSAAYGAGAGGTPGGTGPKALIKS